MGQRGRKILLDLGKCKAQGICDRDKLATEYLRVRIENFQRRMQTVNEGFRKEMELPPCPPICDNEVIEHE